MRKMKVAIAAGSLFGFVSLLSGVAGASPLALDQGLAAADELSPTEGSIIRVYGGCGPYAHRNPWGYCVPGGQWGGYPVRPYVQRACPPGFHLGPYGHYCWPN